MRYLFAKISTKEILIIKHDENKRCKYLPWDYFIYKSFPNQEMVYDKIFKKTQNVLVLIFPL